MRTCQNPKNMLNNIIFHPFYLQIHRKAVPLHCVFHSIRFKVNKVGAKRCSFFFTHTPSIPFLRSTPTGLNQKHVKEHNFSSFLFADSPKSRTFALCFS